MNSVIELHNEIKEIEVSEIKDLNLSIFDNASLTLKILNLKKENNVKIVAKVGYNSHLIVIFADFSTGNSEVVSKVDLVEENASAEWHLATLANGISQKKFDVSFNHLVGHTNALMDNYGVARDKSKVVFSGSNHIEKGAKKSVTNQIAKVIVFDPDAIGVASPKLCIDENDVIASHSAVVGQLNSDHMFYLMSRGLNKDEARELITRGYLQPISRYFSDENKAKIEAAIKEAM